MFLKNYRQNFSSAHQPALWDLLFSHEYVPTCGFYDLSFSHALLSHDVVNELSRTLMAFYDRMMMHVYCMSY